MAIIYFEGAAKLNVREDAGAVEMAIRKAREDRSAFVQLTLDRDDGMTWVNTDRILRFTE